MTGPLNRWWRRAISTALVVLCALCLEMSLEAQTLDVPRGNPPVPEKVPPVSQPAGGSKGSAGIPLFSLNIADTQDPTDLTPALRVVAVLTLMTFVPALILLSSAFTRILIVLSFLRQALGSQNMPPNQVLIGMSLFLTWFVMAPQLERISQDAITPYLSKSITAEVALEKGQEPLKNFMLAQTRHEDLALFFQLGRESKPQTPQDTPFRVLAPAFVISELRAAFQIGFLVYLPFIVIDMIVSSVLMAMGMMMLPPTLVSLPVKLVLFVIVDGWNLLAGSLVRSFL